MEENIAKLEAALVLNVKFAQTVIQTEERL